MKRDNKLVKFTTLVLLVTMVAISLVSGTYAKYTAKATGTDSAKVAHWSIKIGEKDIAKEDTIEFNLFDTTKLIAPGSEGTFDSIIVTNDSEVDATYSIAYEITNESNVPLLFKVGEGEWTSDLTALNATADLAKGASSAEAATAVQWKWAYEVDGDANAIAAGDLVDTGLGTADEAPEVIVTVTITATQAAPAAN